MQKRTCRICKSKKLVKIFSLGKQALANNLPDRPGKIKRYPLDLYQCSHCSFIQLGYVVPKEKMYDNYFYIPSVSKTHLKHFEDLAQHLIGVLMLKDKSLVVDIGSSDGSLLVCFKKRGMRVAGVEPAKNIKVKVPSYRDYFSCSLARKIVKLQGKAKLVTATNSFAHIDNLEEYLQALDILLDDDGVFFAQFPDVRNLLKENQFDTIYHEHLSYFSHESLYHLFSNSPFEIIRIESNEIHGGSMRLYVRRRPKLLENFVKQTKIIQDQLYNYLDEQKLAGKKIAGFGAAAKGMVLLQYCNLDNTIIDYIADGTLYKQGKFTPATNIPILPEEELVRNPPDIVLILAWNFKEEIMNKLKGRGYQFVIPIPKVEVV